MHIRSRHRARSRSWVVACAAHLHAALLTAPSGSSSHLRHARRDRGQATAEYVLVLLGAASVALVLLGWLARSGRIEGLLEQVFDRITAQL